MSCRLLVERLLTVEEAAGWTTGEEQRQAASFGSVRRCREYLSWRAVVRRALGREVEIAYNAVGAPVLVGRAEHISVSHGADRVAVVIADHPVGVDIERTDRRFERVRSRYLTPVEEQLSSEPLFLCAVWCAKEALYKLAGDRTCSLRDDLHLLSYTADRLTAQIKNGEPITLSVIRHEEYLVVYTC